MNSFCLMFRLTKRCNARCEYCSTDTTQLAYIDLVEVEKCLTGVVMYVEENLPQSANSIDLTICLLGGELSTLPVAYLKKVKDLMLRKMALFKSITIGMQTNLIMSTSKLDNIHVLFDGKIGTSVDNFTNSRTLNGCPDKYRTILRRNILHLKENHKASIGACYVVIGDKLSDVEKEVDKANNDKYSLKLIIGRKNSSGFKSNDSGNLIELEALYLKLLNDWFMKSSIAIDPFLYMLNRKIDLISGNGLTCFESCNHTNKCHEVGLCIEPNGDYYYCQELADLNTLKLGNFLSGEFNCNVKDLSLFREVNIMSNCSSCLHFQSCKGGCMAYSLDQGYGATSKDPYCSIYNALFERIDELINQSNYKDLIKWKNILI